MEGGDGHFYCIVVYLLGVGLNSSRDSGGTGKGWTVSEDKWRGR